MKDFSKLCTPAKIYFAIAVLAAVVGLLNGLTVMMALWNLVFAFIWAYVLGWLCEKGYDSVSWFLVLLPYIIILLAMFNIYHVTQEQRQMMRAVQLQGAYGQEAMMTRENTQTYTPPTPPPHMRDRR
jgi:hypothetical protein